MAVNNSEKGNAADNDFWRIPPRKTRAITGLLISMYIILVITLSLVEFPGGNGESFLMHIIDIVKSNITNPVPASYAGLH